MADWFAQNAPKASGGDWFAANQPKTGPRDIALPRDTAPARNETPDQRVRRLLGGTDRNSPEWSANVKSAIAQTPDGPLRDRLVAGLKRANLPGGPTPAMPEQTADERYEATWGDKPLLPESARAAMNTPLIRPTGVDSIDALTSPTSLLVGAVAGGPAAVRSVVKPGLTLAGRAAGGAGAVLKAVAPQAKYELAKQALMAVHIPEPAAALIAMGLSGMKRGAKGAPSATPPAEPVPVAAEPTTMAQAPRPAPAAPAPRPAPDVAPAVQSAPPAAAPVKPAPFNPNTALKDAREAFVARGEAPRPAEVSNVAEHLRRGKTPDEALDIVLSKRSATAPAKPAAPAKPSFTAEEVALGQRLMARGKTQQQAIDAILAQRAFKQMPGVLSDAGARAELDARNAAGKIKSPSAQTARERRR